MVSVCEVWFGSKPGEPSTNIQQSLDLRTEVLPSGVCIPFLRFTFHAYASCVPLSSNHSSLVSTVLSAALPLLNTAAFQQQAPPRLCGGA